MVFSRILSIGVLLATTMLPVLAQSDTEPVRVYTNADLERLAPLAVDTTPVARHDDAEWEFVVDFLERERARIDADRAHRIEERRVNLEQAVVEDRRERTHYRVPYWSYPYGHRYHDTRHKGPGSDRRIGVPGRTELIVPLHARPSLAQIQRAKATRRSGVDAFPSNARASR